MSSREPMWYCHECHAEMRPLMQPDPICASCQGTFVEKIEDPSDDPRAYQQHAPRGGFDDEIPPNLGGFLGAHSCVHGKTPTAAITGNPRSRSPTFPRSPEGVPGGIRLEFHSTGPSHGATRTLFLGGPNTLNRPRSPEQQRDGELPTMSEFLRRENQSGPRQPGDITGPMMAQYLLALLGQGQTGRGLDPFAEMFSLGPEGGPGGRWGDYVFNQEALDQVITQIMENSASRPVPATDEIINNLPREVLMERSPLLDKDCAVCKDQFQLGTDDPEEQVIVTLPCKHPFHQPCILPWLKSSGTCPVCRYALIEQAQQSRPPGSPPGPGSGPSSRSTSPSSAPPRPRSPGNSGRSGGGLFQSLFGGSMGSSRAAGSSSSQGRNSSSRGARRAGTSNVSPSSTPPFPGRWDE
ncbi:uncharacterized protein EDB93DRAFT_1310544, partial [Suillus bovinus]|uniref:uncharacterized protein n=1 Tax=Suillus bovinus TaxID=48563 RepID=UPI001B871C35